MSSQAISFILQSQILADLPDKARLIALCLGHHTYNLTGRSVRKIRDIMQSTGIRSDKTVRVYLKTLESCGLIRRFKRFAANGARLADEIELCGFLEWYGSKKSSNSKQFSEGLPDNPPGNMITAPPGNMITAPPGNMITAQDKDSLKDSLNSGKERDENHSNLEPQIKSPDFQDKNAGQKKEKIPMYQRLLEAGANPGIVEHFIKPMRCVRLAGHHTLEFFMDLCEALSGFELQAIADVAAKMRFSSVFFPDIATILAEVRKENEKHLVEISEQSCPRIWRAVLAEKNISDPAYANLMMRGLLPRVKVSKKIIDQMKKTIDQ